MSTADITECVRLLAAAERVDQTGENIDADELAEDLSASGVDLTSDTLIGEAAGGRVRAFGLVSGPITARSFFRVGLWGTVDPEYRGQGVGRKLLDWQLRRGAELHRARFPDRAGLLMANCPDRAAGPCRLYKRAGLTPVRWFNTMCRDLSGPLPEALPPDGFTLVGYTSARDEAVRQAHNEAFAEHWGSSVVTRQAWRQQRQAKSFRPELSFLVLDPDGEVVAYLLDYYWAVDTAVTGVRMVYAGQIGTRRLWRRQGLAASLISRALHAAREAGYERAVLDVDTENPTGALGLYERLGYVLEKRWVSYGRELAPARRGETGAGDDAVRPVRPVRPM